MYTSVLAVESFNIRFILGVSCFWHCNDVFVHVHIGEFKVAIFICTVLCVSIYPKSKDKHQWKTFCEHFIIGLAAIMATLQILVIAGVGIAKAS